MVRGMPKHAKLLRDLLDEKDRWRASASSYFIAVRTDAAMNQKDFAASLDISPPYLNQIEHGHRTPSSETLNRLLSFTEGATSGDTNQDQEEDSGTTEDA